MTLRFPFNYYTVSFLLVITENIIANKDTAIVAVGNRTNITKNADTANLLNVLIATETYWGVLLMEN